MFISIIIATKLPSSDLLSTIESIKNQKLASYEIIIIDSDSKYNWEDYFGNLYEKIDHFVSEPDNGIYNAWNKGLLISKGDWIIFLGEGDIFYNDMVLKKYSDIIKLQNNLDYVYGDIIISNKIYSKPWILNKNKMKSCMPIPHVGMAHNVKLFNKFGLFDEKLKICGDFEFFIRTINSAKIYYEKNLISVIMKPNGISADHRSGIKIIKEIFYANKINNKQALTFDYILVAATYALKYYIFIIKNILKVSK